MAGGVAHELARRAAKLKGMSPLKKSGSMANDPGNLIWIDLEMTGLDTDSDYIIEIATIVTTSDLEMVAEGPVHAIYQPDAVLAGMDEWNQTHHGSSGLLQRVKDSPMSSADAEAATLGFLTAHVPAGCSPMCGNSICQDRRFMARQMPELERYFHYRHIDVSTVKELCARWAPNTASGHKKNAIHLALQDIRDSIDELKYYREHFLRLD
jgi:oligoribonuclease